MMRATAGQTEQSVRNRSGTPQDSAGVLGCLDLKRSRTFNSTSKWKSSKPVTGAINSSSFLLYILLFPKTT
jgi:hypothetical protein